jgi:hypothetical protein
MGFAGLVALSIGILLVILSANGRLQPTIAAMFGQATPGATPIGGSTGSSSSGGTASPGGGGLFGWLSNLLQGSGGGDGGSASNPNDPGGVPII